MTVTFLYAVSMLLLGSANYRFKLHYINDIVGELDKGHTCMCSELLATCVIYINTEMRHKHKGMICGS